MNDPIHFLVQVAQGPIVRCCVALMVLGCARAVILACSDTLAGYMTASEPAEFWRKFRRRLLWLAAPTPILRDAGYIKGRASFIYHASLATLALIMRTGAIIVPMFMFAHVVWWDRNFGLAWVSLPGTIAEWLSVITIIAGVLLFLGRVYSPVVRAVDPTWTVFKPLLLVLPFAMGYLAMHPRWCPVDYNVVMLIHILSACAVFIMVPYGRMLACLHTRLTDLFPEYAWTPPRRDPRAEDSSLVTS